MFRPESRRIIGVYTTHLLMMMSFWCVVPILALFSVSVGASLTLAGLVVATSYLVPSLTSVPFGIFADKIGRTKLLYAGSGLAIGGLLSTAFITDPFQLILTRVFSGLGIAMYYPIIYSEVADLAQPGGLGKAMANFGVVIQTGALLGPLVGGFVAQALGYRDVFLIASLIAAPTLIGIQIILRNAPRSRQAENGGVEPTSGSLREDVNGRFAAGLFAASILATASGVFSVILPVYLVSTVHATDTRGLGILFSVGAVGSIVARSLFASLSDRYGRMPVICLGLLLISGGSALLGLRSDVVSSAVVVLAIAIGQALGISAAGALIAESLPRARRGMSMGSFQASSNGGVAVSSSTLGFLAEQFSFAVAIGFESTLTLVVSGAIFFVLRRAPPPVKKAVAAQVTS
jgi:MFS family permease